MALYILILSGLGTAVAVIAVLALCFRRLNGSALEAAALAKRLAQQELISAIFQSFISSEKTGTLIHNALMMLLMSMKVSRAVLAHLDRETGMIGFKYDWSDPKQKLKPLAADGIPFVDGNIFYDMFMTKGDVYLSCNDIREFPEYGKMFEGLGFKSFVCVPINLRGDFLGVLGVVQCDAIRKWEESDIRLLRMAAGAISTLLARAETEAELVTAKAQAEQSSKAKSYFLSRMSHEMRTPMNAVIGMTAIARKSDDHAKISNCLERINEASLHLLGVINDILDISKIESGKFDISNSEFEFEKMLKRVIDIMEFKISEKKQNFIFRLDQNIPPYIASDEQRLAQVLANLLSNAVKFTPDAGTIILSVKALSTDGDLISLRFDVIDSGIGISPEQAGRLFTLFEQADESISRRFGGTGLGLAVSRSIINLMGGKIWVDSELGKGSDFAFEVSVKKGKAIPIAAQYQKLSNFNLKILVIDSSRETHDFFREYSQRMGIFHVSALNAVEALRIMETGGEFDFIFYEWNLSEANNTEQIRMLKSLFSGRALIVTASGVEWEKIEKDAKDAGVNGYLPKPLFPSTLGETINKYLGVEETPVLPEEKLDGIFSAYTILLAEDVDINREIVMSLLEETGVSIDCAKNGIEALNLFKENPAKYDAILMDIHMPEMDGYEATRHIREFEAALNAGSGQVPGVPIIAMTADVFAEDIDLCFAAGMNGHLGKPIDAGMLIAALRNHLLKSTNS